MLLSFAVIEVHVKAIEVFAMLALAFIQTTVLMKISDCLLLLEIIKKPTSLLMKFTLSV